MNTQKIGKSDITSPRLAYGCMRIVGTWNPMEITPERAEDARKALMAAYEAGYTLFDHADIYCRGACEAHHGLLLRDSPDLRRSTTIATKCGVRFKDTPHPGDPGRYEFSREWIIHSCEESLKRLGVEQIDIYQLHRPDMLMNPEEVAEAFDHLKESGKVRWFGVSNFTPSYLALLQKFCREPLVVNQVEISLKRRESLTDGTLDQCISERITPLAWSPLAGGSLGEGDGALQEIADNHGVHPAVVALAWLLKHPSGILPIVGSTTPENIRAMTEADRVELTREEWYQLTIAAQGHPMA